MRRAFGSVFALATFALPLVVSAQDGDSRAVAGGGVTVTGWTGKADAAEEAKGLTITSAKFAPMGNGFHITTGPAATYWNPANKATGNYTVKATFNEAKYMNLNDHPHPYGVMIGGNELGTANQSLLYCSAYGDGTFIVRGFAPGTPRGTFAVGGRAPVANEAIHKAAGKDQPVSQEIAIQVTADKVSCIINGTAVWSGPKADVVGTGKLASTDGVYGIRTAHNTEVHVAGFAMTKQ